jgi:hypothetical protein
MRGVGRSTTSPVVAGQDPAYWAQDGIVISAPTSQPRLTAEDAVRSALDRHPGATNLEVKLVHMKHSGQFVPTANYWAVSGTPPPGTVGTGGPARTNPKPPHPLAQMVVFVDAETGRVPLTRMWGSRTRLTSAGRENKSAQASHRRRSLAAVSEGRRCY